MLLTSTVDIVEKSRENEVNDKLHHQILQNDHKRNEISVGYYIGEREIRMIFFFFFVTGLNGMI